MKIGPRGISALAAVVLWTAATASASVRADIPLPFVVNNCRFAVAVKVDAVNVKRGYIVFGHAADLKGKTKFRKFKHNLSTGDHGHADEILSTVQVGDRAVLFYTDEAAAGITAFAHVRGFWYQVHGRNEADPDTVWWSFTHQLQMMALAYSGDSEALEKAVRELLAGRTVEVPRRAGPNDKRIIRVTIALKDDKRPAAAGSEDKRREPAGDAGRN